MANSKYCSEIVSGIFLFIVVATEVSSLVWKLKPGQTGSGGNLGTYGGFYGGQGMRGDYGQWGSGGQSWGSGGQGWGSGGQGWGSGGQGWGSGGQGWGSGGQGSGNTGWNDAWVNQGNRGNQGGSKGTTFRSCYDSRQCWPGECCRATGYGGGRCDTVAYGSTHGCIQSRPPTDGWQKPVYPQKPGIWQPPRDTGRPGFCPPQVQWQGRAQFCRQDQDCPSFQKCCYMHGKPVCMNAVFT